MLSATSTQSPLATVSSVFTMPTISMPTVSMATSALGGLTDHLFMSHLPSATDSPSHSDVKNDNGNYHYLGLCGGMIFFCFSVDIFFFFFDFTVTVLYFTIYLLLIFFQFPLICYSL